MTKQIFIFFDKKLDINEIAKLLKNISGLKYYKTVELKEKRCLFCKIESESFSIFMESLNNSKFKNLFSIEDAIKIN